MADIALRSTQNIHGGGVGYRPTNTKPTARYTVSKTITKTADTRATVTLVITIKTNNEFVAVGLGETLTYQLVIDGVQRGSVVLKTAAQTMNASGTYTRTLVATNVPLDHRTTQPANLRLVNNKRNDWTFNSNTQGGDEIVGLPIGIQRSNFSSFSNFTLSNSATTFNATVSRVSAGTVHDVSLWHGGTKITEWLGQNNFTSLSLTLAQSRALLNRISTSTTATVILRVITVHNGSSLYTQERSATVTVGEKPTIGAVGISDSSGALATIGNLVQGVSDVTLSINSVSAGFGATVSHYGYNWAGLDYRDVATSSLKTGVITRSGSQVFEGRFANSRGQVARRERTDTVLPWQPPTSSSVRIERCLANGTVDPAGTSIKVSGTHSVSPLKVGTTNKNTLRVLVRYRLANTTTWTTPLNKTYPAGTVSTSESHTLGSGAFDPTKTYEVQVIVYDRYASTLITHLLPTEAVLMSYVGNDGVGFGKIRERGIIDAKGDVYIEGDLNLDGGFNPTNNLSLNGLSARWGVTDGENTGAVNAIMGTGSSATWLISGTSGGVFRAGWQVQDQATSMRFALGDNYYYLHGDTGTIWHTGNLQTSTSQTANTVPLRDSGGRFNTATPTAFSHVVPKGYVDYASTVTWASDDRVWHEKPSGSYSVANQTGYPANYGFIMHMVGSNQNLMSQIFVSFNGFLRVRICNVNQSMDWHTVT